MLNIIHPAGNPFKMFRTINEKSDRGACSALARATPIYYLKAAR